MATAPADIQNEPVDTGQDDAPVDFAAEASRMGWKPLEEFNGDPTKHVDAETFYKRGQEMMPILKAQNKTLLKRLETLEREHKKSAEFFSKGEERAYQRALADIRAEQEAAVESGDIEAHRKAAKKLDELEKPAAKVSDDISPEQRAEDFADWGKVNKWYATNSVMQSYADAQAAVIANKKGGYLDREDLDAVAAKVRAKFEDEFPDDFGAAAKPKPRSAVEPPSGNRGRSNGNSYNDLPPEAKAMCERWIKNGTIKSREDYVKNFDFKGFNA